MENTTTQDEKKRQQQTITFHLLPSGELKIQGNIDQKSQAEIAQQFFDAASLQRRVTENKIDELTKWNNLYQHIVIISLLILTVFTISFVVGRTIQRSFSNSFIEVKTNA